MKNKYQINLQAWDRVRKQVPSFVDRQVDYQLKCQVWDRIKETKHHVWMTLKEYINL